jgi:hypothetical protein
MSQSTFQQLVGNPSPPSLVHFELLMAPIAKMQSGPAGKPPAGGKRHSISG